MKESNPQTTPDQERSERLETGKTIARGGKSNGVVPGATENSSNNLHDPSGQPQPPDPSVPVDEQKRRAVAHAVAQLGEDADGKEIAETCHAQSGIDMTAGEAAAVASSLAQ